jgi:hypothetical protein
MPITSTLDASNLLQLLLNPLADQKVTFSGMTVQVDEHAMIDTIVNERRLAPFVEAKCGEPFFRTQILLHCRQALLIFWES